MTYDEFLSKWVGKRLYDDGAIRSLAGIITVFKNQELNIGYMEGVGDVFWIPKWHGWKDDKQRREFYKDAKLVGVRKKPKEKNEWYKFTTMKFK
jgi:hypothetical protein